MLSLGAAAFLEDGTMVSTWTANFDLLEGAEGDEDTMRWWSTQPEAWEACRKDPKRPRDAMFEFHDWLTDLEAEYKPVFVGYPAGFDFLFVYWYLIKFVGESSFSFSALDIKTYAAAVLGIPFRQSTKKNYPRRWFEGQPKHNHVALQDAIGQGMLFIKMLQGNKGL
jgi:hypothetical protein